MSGGYFEYQQYHIQDIIEKLEETKVKISESLKGISKEERSSWKTNKGVPLTQDHIANIKKTKKDVIISRNNIRLLHLRTCEIIR